MLRGKYQVAKVIPPEAPTLSSTCKQAGELLWASRDLGHLAGQGVEGREGDFFYHPILHC